LLPLFLRQFVNSHGPLSWSSFLFPLQDLLGILPVRAGADIRHSSASPSSVITGCLTFAAQVTASVALVSVSTGASASAWNFFCAGVYFQFLPVLHSTKYHRPRNPHRRSGTP